MFERLQKPFLTVETGEAYQPIRLTYELYQKDKLIEKLDQLKCCEKKANKWYWYWTEECSDLHFESVDTFTPPKERLIRLGSLVINENKLCLNLTSFKRACLAVVFFHRILGIDVAQSHHADFINKVFDLNERLPHGFAELFKEEELEKIVQQRLLDYAQVQKEVEQASTVEEAFQLLSTYTQREASKRLPYSERYVFQYPEDKTLDAEMIFLGFYIFLRSRELVAIRRWYGETGYNLADVSDEAVDQVFGGMDIDLIE